jgi:hypothetical protein
MPTDAKPPSAPGLNCPLRPGFFSPHSAQSSAAFSMKAVKVEDQNDPLSKFGLDRLLHNSALGPEELERFADAYEQTLIALRLKGRDDSLTQIIAHKVIEVSQTGFKDPAQISARAIEELGLT